MKALLSILFFFFAIHSFAQSEDPKEYPESYVDIGMGLGPNHGIFGIKTVIGYKGTGLLLGIGSFDGFTTTEVGIQVSYRWWFANIGFGAYGSYEISGPLGVVDKGLIEGTIFMTGGKVNLLKNKALFLELGMGYTGGGSTPVVAGQEVEENGPTFSLGIGYRIGK